MFMIKLITLACLEWTRATEVALGHYVEELEDNCWRAECHKLPASGNCPAECLNMDGAVAEAELVNSVREFLSDIPADDPDLFFTYQQTWDMMETRLEELGLEHRTWKSLPGVREYVLMKRYLMEILEKVDSNEFTSGAIQLFHELSNTRKKFYDDESLGLAALRSQEETIEPLLTKAGVIGGIDGFLDTMDALRRAVQMPKDIMLPLVVTQITMDHEHSAFAPKLNGIYEHVPSVALQDGEPEEFALIHSHQDNERLSDISWDDGQTLELVMDSPIARKANVMVLGLKDPSDNLVIKYQTNCDEIGTLVTDIMRDAWFLEIAAQYGVSPRMILLSPPATLSLDSAETVGFDMSTDELVERMTNCVNHPYGAEIRYMVTERIDYTVFEIVYSRDPVPQLLTLSKPLMMKSVTSLNRVKAALNMAIGVIDKLRTLHTLELPVVHGDIHYGNIAVRLRGENRNTMPEPEDFVLIDFGKAFFEAERSPRDDRESWTANCFLSHFNLKGSRLGFRDDVYKTLLAAAFVMIGPRLVKVCADRAKDADERKLISFHEKFGLFDKLSIDELPTLDMDEIKGHLAEALALARGVRRVTDRPNYAEIIKHLEAAKASIQPSGEAQ